MATHPYLSMLQHGLLAEVDRSTLLSTAAVSTSASKHRTDVRATEVRVVLEEQGFFKLTQWEC